VEEEGVTFDDVLSRVKNAAQRSIEKWKGTSDAMKAHRAIDGYEYGYLELRRTYNRKTTCKILDKLFGVSERHIRRVLTIRTKRPDIAARLETFAMRGGMSLELAEYIVNHATKADAIEAVWLSATDKERDIFLERIKASSDYLAGK
jgi:hypothetical protein